MEPGHLILELRAPALSTIVGKEIPGICRNSELERRERFLSGDANNLKIIRDVKSLMVARDGIEPPTRGFSVLCSTD